MHVSPLEETTKKKTLIFRGVLFCLGWDYFDKQLQGHLVLEDESKIINLKSHSVKDAV